MTRVKALRCRRRMLRGRAEEVIMNAVAAWHEEHAYFNRLLLLPMEEVDTL